MGDDKCSSDFSFMENVAHLLPKALGERVLNMFGVPNNERPEKLLMPERDWFTLDSQKTTLTSKDILAHFLPKGLGETVVNMFGVSNNERPEKLLMPETDWFTPDSQKTTLTSKAILARLLPKDLGESVVNMFGASNNERPEKLLMPEMGQFTPENKQATLTPAYSLTPKEEGEKPESFLSNENGKPIKSKERTLSVTHLFAETVHAKNFELPDLFTSAESISPQKEPKDSANTANISGTASNYVKNNLGKTGVAIAGGIVAAKIIKDALDIVTMALQALSGKLFTDLFAKVKDIGKGPIGALALRIGRAVSQLQRGVKTSLLASKGVSSAIDSVRKVSQGTLQILQNVLGKSKTLSTMIKSASIAVRKLKSIFGIGVFQKAGSVVQKAAESGAGSSASILSLLETMNVKLDVIIGCACGKAGKQCQENLSRKPVEVAESKSSQNIKNFTTSNGAVAAGAIGSSAALAAAQNGSPPPIVVPSQFTSTVPPVSSPQPEIPKLDMMGDVIDQFASDKPKPPESPWMKAALMAPLLPILLPLSEATPFLGFATAMTGGMTLSSTSAPEKKDVQSEEFLSLSSEKSTTILSPLLLPEKNKHEEKDRQNDQDNTFPVSIGDAGLSFYTFSHPSLPGAAMQSLSSPTSLVQSTPPLEEPPKVEVMVTFQNTPIGTRTSTKSTGNVSVSTNVGYSQAFSSDM